MNILCRIGLHSWKPRCKYGPITLGTRQSFFIMPPVPSYIPIFGYAWRHIASKCRCCGKRVEL